MTDPAAAVVIWHFSDGKPGHDNQSRGLLRALSARLPVQIHTLDVPPSGKRAALQHLLDLLRRRSIAPRRLPDPALIIGAGHATHLPMLAARRARGGRVVVLMTPSLPLRCFDLCIVPAHDAIAPRANVLSTRGPLNVIAPAAQKLDRHGLILLGGPSKHHRWSDRQMLDCIESIAGRDPKWRWTVAGSRRTPESMESALAALQVPTLTYVAARDTGPEWLPFRLAEAPRVWVSEDSMSMLYEALSGGAAVGVLPVPRRGVDRISRGIEQLMAAQLVTRYADWQAGAELAAPGEQFNEAARCAAWIDEQWLSAR